MKKALVIFFISMGVLILGCALAEEQNASQSQQMEKQNQEKQGKSNKKQEMPAPQILKVTIGPPVQQEQKNQPSK